VGVLRLQEGDEKLHKDILVLLPASIVVSGGGKRRAMAVTRVPWVSSFAGRNPHHVGHYL
jgi:hypothetical protein